MFSAIITVALLAQVEAPPVPPAPALPEDVGRWEMFVLLDESLESRGVESQFARRAMTGPDYDASQVLGVPIRVERVQGFDQRAPGVRFGYGGGWTPLVHTCPCCVDLGWEELEYRVLVHQERLKLTEYEHVVRWRRWHRLITQTATVRYSPRWPTPPSRRIGELEAAERVAWRVWCGFPIGG